MADSMPLNANDEDITIIRWKEKRRLVHDIHDWDFKTKTCAVLRGLLDDRGLAITGKKHKLVDRLTKYLQDNAHFLTDDPPSPPPLKAEEPTTTKAPEHVNDGLPFHDLTKTLEAGTDVKFILRDTIHIGRILKVISGAEEDEIYEVTAAPLHGDPQDTEVRLLRRSALLKPSKEEMGMPKFNAAVSKGVEASKKAQKISKGSKCLKRVKRSQIARKLELGRASTGTWGKGGRRPSSATWAAARCFII